MLPVEREAVVEFLRCMADMANTSTGLFVATAMFLGTDDRTLLLAGNAYTATETTQPAYPATDDEWREYYRDRALNAALLVEEGEI